MADCVGLKRFKSRRMLQAKHPLLCERSCSCKGPAPDVLGPLPQKFQLFHKWEGMY
ncbi:hypothetical protein SAMN05444581_11121 [Methylocapsa palsarum]|uniref:Uncharacterized protein n=1 Tax=Methylocapsa palsarum TaxID=1612308 RepID=A0A1I4AQ95_9HYPH|nr:hypothetical protein SAMN05444581_11121 [Methylocapsa palsarum]